MWLLGKMRVLSLLRWITSLHRYSLVTLSLQKIWKLFSIYLSFSKQFICRISFANLSYRLRKIDCITTSLTLSTAHFSPMLITSSTIAPIFLSVISLQRMCDITFWLILWQFWFNNVIQMSNFCSTKTTAAADDDLIRVETCANSCGPRRSKEAASTAVDDELIRFETCTDPCGPTSPKR